MPKGTHPPVHGTVRMTISINKQDYIVVPNGIGQYQDCPSFILRKVGTDLRYTVQRGNAGVSCSCPDFRKRPRQDEACKHIKALEVFYMLR